MEAVREEGHLWMPGSLWKPKKYTALACFTTQYGIPFLLERVLYHGCVCGGSCVRVCARLGGGSGEGGVWRRPLLPRSPRLSPLHSGTATGGQGRAGQGGAGPRASSAAAQESDAACVLVSEQFHVERPRVRVRVVCLICEEVTGVWCSNPVGRWPLIRFPGCHYRHFQNPIPHRTNRLGFTLRAHA